MRKICFISVLLSLLLAGCGHPEVRMAQGLIDTADTTVCGSSWSVPVKTNIPDSRSKQCAGTLPDGRSFWVGNPTGNKARRVLALGLSQDGYLFNQAYLLLSPTDLPPQRQKGRYKTLGYNYPKATVIDDTLWICLSFNKEDAVLVKVSEY